MTAFIVKDGRYEASVAILSFTNMQSLQRTSKRTWLVQALKYAGYKAFNERFPTDHRAYIFDFDTEKLFGNSTQVLAPPPLQILQSTYVKQVTQ